jgi:hypothetical protein
MTGPKILNRTLTLSIDPTVAVCLSSGSFIIFDQDSATNSSLQIAPGGISQVGPSAAVAQVHRPAARPVRALTRPDYQGSGLRTAFTSEAYLELKLALAQPTRNIGAARSLGFSRSIGLKGF